MQTILIYGANGYTGRLIAERAAQDPAHRYVLAARRAETVRDLARGLGMDWRAFALDVAEDVRNGLRGVSLVINAAGPFALTASRLAKSAIRQKAHYVDICGEVEAYLEVRELRELAELQQVALVCGAAQTPGVSNLMLEQALSRLDQESTLREVRIGMTRPQSLSSGSLQTFLGSVQDRVVVARPSGNLRTVPVGRLQHGFRFGDGGDRLRTASAASLVDTVAACDCLRAHGRRAESVVSYLEAGSWARAGADLGALAEPLRALPGARAWAGMVAPLLSTASTATAATGDEHTVVVEIEDMARRCVDERRRTPGVYRASATLVLCAAASVLANGRYSGRYSGWVHPGRALAEAPAEVIDRFGAAEWPRQP